MIFTNPVNISKAKTSVSFNMGGIHSKRKKPFGDGKLVKEYLFTVSDLLNVIKVVQLSRNSVARRTKSRLKILRENNN